MGWYSWYGWGLGGAELHHAKGCTIIVPKIGAGGGDRSKVPIRGHGEGFGGVKAGLGVLEYTLAVKVGGLFGMTLCLSLVSRTLWQGQGERWRDGVGLGMKSAWGLGSA